MCWSKKNKLAQYFSFKAVGGSEDDASDIDFSVKGNPDIVVIGAGAAGLACAVSLLEFGIKNIKILEAENRIGGRIHTVPFGKNYVDCGARFCIGENGNPVYDLVKDSSLLISCADIHFSLQHIRSNGDVVPRSLAIRFSTILTELMNSSRRFLYEGSVEEYMKQGFFKALRERRESFSTSTKLMREYCENLIKSANFYQVSMNNHSKLYDCPGDPMLGWRYKGYIDFLEKLIKTDEGNELGILSPYITFNKRVKSIQWNQDDGKVIIECYDADTFTCDMVVVTVPLGVLKKYHDDMFSPNVTSSKKNAIEGLAFRQICQVYLEFDYSFWPEHWTGFALLWRQNDVDHLLQKKKDLAWISDITHIHTVKNQPNVLVGFVAGYSAKLVEQMTEKQVGAGFLYALTIFLKTMDVQLAKTVLRSKWCSNEHFLGGYSFRSGVTEARQIPIGELGVPLTSDIIQGKPEILFAGEATSEKFYSTVHGAVESGNREAKRIARYYSMNI